MRRDAPASHSMRDCAWGYTLAGGLAAGVDVGGFHWLAPRLEPLLLAAVLSFVLAAMVNYTLSSLWVYRRPWRSLRRAALFLGLACVGLAVNAGVTWWLASAWPVHATLAKVGGVASAFLINFWMNTRLVFARVGASQASP
jgi:putative flippase GtrA